LEATTLNHPFNLRQAIT